MPSHHLTCKGTESHDMGHKKGNDKKLENKGSNYFQPVNLIISHTGSIKKIKQDQTEVGLIRMTQHGT